MNFVKPLATTFLVLGLAACSSPEDLAESLIAEFCDAYRSNDLEALNELTTAAEFKNFNLSSDKDRKNAECGKSIKKVNDKKFIFILKESGFSAPIKVEDINGDFKVTGFNM